MKKIICVLIICVLALVVYILVMNNYSFGNWSSKNINDIKDESDELDEKIKEAREINIQTYPESISRLENNGKELKNKKQEFELKTKALETQNVNLGIIETKQYKIERLWITMENYAKRKNLELKLDVVDAGAGEQNLYNLNITLVGDYIDITDFVYSIENDDTLGFKIMDFRLEPYSSNAESNQQNSGSEEQQEATTSEEENDTPSPEEETENNSSGSSNASTTSANYTQYIDVGKLKATFTVEYVGIEFD